MAPAGRAFLKGAAYTPPHEEPSEDYPLRYTTGRTAYQFHTRTKTGRARSLHRAAPDAWVELSPADADRSASPRATGSGSSRPGAPSRCAPGSDGDAGAVFAPFHYGHWDPDELAPDAEHRLANELTMTVWDPVSKQPFQDRACRVTKVRDGDGPAPAPTTAASAPAPTTPRQRRRRRRGRPPPREVLERHPAYALDPSNGSPDAAPVHLRRPGRPQRADPRRLLPRGRVTGTPTRPTSSTPATCWPR